MYEEEKTGRRVKDLKVGKINSLLKEVWGGGGGLQKGEKNLLQS